MKGDTVVLKCITLGGNLSSDDDSIFQHICRAKQNLRDLYVSGDPTPQVTWWRDSHLIDSSFEGTYKQTVQNTLSIPNISTEDLLAELTCSATNNNITMPVKTSVVIEMKCKGL